MATQRMYTRVCTRVCIHMCVYIDINTTCACTDNACEYMHVCVHTNIIHVYKLCCACTHLYVYACMYTHTRVYTRVHVHGGALGIVEYKIPIREEREGATEK
jgi:hypothetical protein